MAHVSHAPGNVLHKLLFHVVSFGRVFLTESYNTTMCFAIENPDVSHYNNIMMVHVYSIDVPVVSKHRIAQPKARNGGHCLYFLPLRYAPKLQAAEQSLTVVGGWEKAAVIQTERIVTLP